MHAWSCGSTQSIANQPNEDRQAKVSTTLNPPIEKFDNIELLVNKQKTPIIYLTQNYNNHIQQSGDLFMKKHQISRPYNWFKAWLNTAHTIITNKSCKNPSSSAESED